MKKRTAVAAGLGAAGLAILPGQLPTAQLYGPTICRARTGRKELALTYDDGPNPRFTPKLLELFERHDAHATFFLIGKWAEREPELIRETVAAGHAIGNHTFSHPTMPFLTVEGVRDEIARCRAAVEASGETFATVDGEALMRPPYGRRRPATLRTLRSEGYVPVTWSITCYDWRKSATEHKIAHRAGRAIEGDVILLHDGYHLDPAWDRSASVAATKDTLERFGAEGYRFVSIPELVAP